MMDSKALAHTLLRLSQHGTSEAAVSSFFDHLGEKNLMGLLPQIKKHIERWQDESTSTNTLVISSKHSLEQNDVNDIIALVKAPADVAVELINDDSIVGGFSAIYDGNIYDGSLRNQVTQLRVRLTQ